MTHPDALLSAYLDGEVTGDESREVRRHLEGCEWCRRELAGLHEARRAVRSLPILESPLQPPPTPASPPRRLVVRVAAGVAALLVVTSIALGRPDQVDPLDLTQPHRELARMVDVGREAPR